MSCTSCKKTKVVKKLEPVKLDETWTPTQEEINIAYAELTSLSGVKESKKELINKVYQFLFGEPFNFDNTVIGFNQARRFSIFLGK